MELARFYELTRQTRLGMKTGPPGRAQGRALLAAKLHLVDGVPVAEAAQRAHISRQAAYRAIKRIPRTFCPLCGAPLPADRAIPESRAAARQNENQEL